MQTTAISEPKELSSTEPIQLHDLVLYDHLGKPCRTYDLVTLAGEALKDTTGKYVNKNQREWFIHYAVTGAGKVPSLSLLYAIIERMHEDQHPGAELLAKELKSPWMCTSTYDDIARNTITHDYDGVVTHDRKIKPLILECDLPKKGHWLKDIPHIPSKEVWQNYLRAELMCRDLDKAMEVIHLFPNMSGFVSVEMGRFNFSCYGPLYDIRGCSRWVSVEELTK